MKTNRSTKLFLLIAVVVLLLTACTSYRTAKGNVRDTIYSVEVTHNGSYKVYMTHDDVAVFCTYDKVVGERAWDILNNWKGEALLTFRSVSERDAEWSLWNGSDCKTTTADEGGIVMFLLLDVQPIEGR